MPNNNEILKSIVTWILPNIRGKKLLLFFGWLVQITIEMDRATVSKSVSRGVLESLEKW
jgi:hypothetical protein